MIYPLTAKIKPVASHLQKQHASRPHELILAWMQIDAMSKDIHASFNNWLEANHQSLNEQEGVDKEVIQEWRRLIRSFVPSYPIQSILLTKESKAIGLTPLIYKVRSNGIYTNEKGWIHLWEQLQVEPLYRIIELSINHYKLYEKRNNNIILHIELPKNRATKQEPIGNFIHSVMRSYAQEPGPIITMGNDDGPTELEALRIAGQIPITAYWNSSSIPCKHTWWNKMMKHGHVIKWENRWIQCFIETAKANNRWKESWNELHKSIKNKRLRFIVIPENNTLLHATPSIIRDIIGAKMQIIRTSLPVFGGIE